MCTLVILRRPGHAWPLLLATNRDEMKSRRWRPPARHWPDRAQVAAGLDEEAGGTWLGVNDDGVAAAVLNRRGSLGRAAGKRSRGELVLEALDHADAAAAAWALADLDPDAYRAFNLVVGDERAAFWLRSRDGETPGPVEVFPLKPGLAMLTAGELDDPESPRIRRYLPRFRAAPVPDPGAGDWQAWQALLRSRDFTPEDGPMSAMCLETEMGFATVSSSLVALPARDRGPDEGPPRVRWLFAPGRPDKTEYQEVDL